MKNSSTFALTIARKRRRSRSGVDRILGQREHAIAESAKQAELGVEELRNVGRASALPPRDACDPSDAGVARHVVEPRPLHRQLGAFACAHPTTAERRDPPRARARAPRSASSSPRRWCAHIWKKLADVPFFRRIVTRSRCTSRRGRPSQSCAACASEAVDLEVDAHVEAPRDRRRRAGGGRPRCRSASTRSDVGAAASRPRRGSAACRSTPAMRSDSDAASVGPRAQATDDAAPPQRIVGACRGRGRDAATALRIGWRQAARQRAGRQRRQVGPPTAARSETRSCQQRHRSRRRAASRHFHFPRHSSMISPLAIADR